MRPQGEEGFTLVELLVVIGIIGILFAVISPLVNRTTRRNELATTVNTAKQYIRQAQLLSRSGHHDDAWGVNIGAAQLILYKGSDFSIRDATFDEVYAIPHGISSTGVTDINFARWSGAASTSGTVTFTSVYTSLTDSFVINLEGAVL